MNNFESCSEDILIKSARWLAFYPLTLSDRKFQSRQQRRENRSVDKLEIRCGEETAHWHENSEVHEKKDLAAGLREPGSRSGLNLVLNKDQSTDP